MKNIEFSKDVLDIDDVEKLVDQICNRIKSDVRGRYSRRGGVIGISGGIDSSVTMALAARALGPDKLLGVMLPEKDSSPDSEEMATRLAEKFGVKAIVENITGALDGYGCYARRDQAVKEVCPSYDPSVDKMKIGVKQNNPVPQQVHLTEGELVEKFLLCLLGTVSIRSRYAFNDILGYSQIFCQLIHLGLVKISNGEEVTTPHLQTSQRSPVRLRAYLGFL